MEQHKVKFIYESPDGGKTICRRPCGEKGPRFLIFQGKYKNIDPIGFN